MVYLGLPGICTILVANKMLEAILHSIGGENNTLMSTMPLHFFYNIFEGTFYSEMFCTALVRGDGAAGQ